MKLLRNVIVFPKEVSKLPRHIKIVSLLVFIYYLGWGFIDPFFSIYIKSKLGSYAAVGYIAGALPLLSILWSIPVGKLVDIMSKQRIIKIILVLYLPMSYIILALQTAMHFLLFRAYHAFISVSLWNALEAYVREHSPKKRVVEAMGLFDSAYSFAAIIGAVIAGFLFSTYGFNLFWILSFTTAMTLICAFFLPDHKKNVSLNDGMHGLMAGGLFTEEIKNFFKCKKLVNYMSISFILNIVSASIGSFMPLIMREYGASYLLIALIYAAFTLPYFFEVYFCSFVNGNRRIMIRFSLLIALAVLAILFFAESIMVVFIALLLFSVAFAAMRPVLEGYQTSITPKKHLGELSGVAYSIKLLGTAIGPIVSGIISEYFGLSYIFVWCFGLMTVVLVISSSKRVIEI